MLHRRLAATALAASTAALLAAPGAASGAQSGDRAPVRVTRSALVLLVGGGLAAATGLAVQQRRSSG